MQAISYQFIIDLPGAMKETDMPKVHALNLVTNSSNIVYEVFESFTQALLSNYHYRFLQNWPLEIDIIEYKVTFWLVIYWLLKDLNDILEEYIWG